MKVSQNIIWLDLGDNVPYGATLVTTKRVLSHVEYEEDDECHPLQTPLSTKIYKDMYLYQLKPVRICAELDSECGA